MSLHRDEKYPCYTSVSQIVSLLAHFMLNMNKVHIFFEKSSYDNIPNLEMQLVGQVLSFFLQKDYKIETKKEKERNSNSFELK